MHTLPGKNQNLHFRRGSQNVAVYLQLGQILTDFNNFCTAETGEKLTKQGMHLLKYYLKKVFLMT